MKRKILAVTLMSIAGIAAAFEADFDKSEFTSGIPRNWKEATNLAAGRNISVQNPTTVDGHTAFTLNFYNATENATRVFYCTNAVENVACDNISACIAVYRRKNLSGKVDRVQVVVSTNDFTTCETVGQIDLQELARETDGWVTNKVSTYIEGLSRAENKYNVKIGLKVIGAGVSSKLGYIGWLKAEFVASATPADVGFVTLADGGNLSAIETLLPGEENARISVTVPGLPAGQIALTNVYADVKRNGQSSGQMLLSRISGTDQYVSAPITPVFDAGEEVSISIRTEYTVVQSQSPLPTLGDQENGIAKEYADNAWHDWVGKKGSVWINEIKKDQNGLAIEFAGTTNRTMTSGWEVSVSNVSTEASVPTSLPITGKLVFTTNVLNRVVGLDVRRFSADAISAGTNVVRLLNSRGVCECMVEIISEGDSFAYGVTGVATWNEEFGFSYDWAGTGDDVSTEGGELNWGEISVDKSTIGEINHLQGFKVPFSTSIRIITKSDSGVDLPFATVDVLAEDVTNVAEPTETHRSVQTSSNGVEIISLSGYSCSVDSIPVTVSAFAFGWFADEISREVDISSPVTNDLLVTMLRVPALDDCDSLKVYWNQTNIVKWAVDTTSLRKSIKLNLYNARAGITNSIMQCANPLSAGGNKYVSMSFDFRNAADANMQNYNELCIVLGTNSMMSGETFEAVALSNKRAEYDKNEWYSYGTLVMLPEGFENRELWLCLVSRTIGGPSSAFLYMDNLRIAFQDTVMPTNLVLQVEDVENVTPTNGQSAAFVLNLVPWTSDEVQEVSADLNLVLNGVTNIVPFAFADGTLTNTISHVGGAQMSITAAALEEALGGPFMTGDEVTYFAAVHYNSANGAINSEELYETRYFPDNSVISNTCTTVDSVTTTNAHWIVEGDYGVSTNLSKYTFTVSGPALSCIGTPEVTMEGVKFTLHGYDANGISSLTLNLNGTDYHPFEGLDTNAQVRVTGEFELPTGLAANTEYTITITATDANGNSITPATFTIVTFPVVTGAVVEPVSQTEAGLTVSGSAAGYVVPAGWTQRSANTWTMGGLSPNVEVTATGIYGTNMNNGVKQESARVDATPGYTLAGVASQAPVIEKGVTTVMVKAGDDYAPVDDGNPAGTEYAIRVTTSAGGDTLVSTNGVEVWKTLDAWTNDAPVEVTPPQIDLAETNSFSFVTRNFDGVVSENAHPIATNCWFKMEAAFSGASAQETAASRSDANFGKVAYSLVLSDPAQSASATATVQYKIGSGEWTTLESFDFEFDEIEKDFASRTWDAWAAVGETDGTYAYQLRAKVAAGGRASEWSEPISGTLDFAPPSGLGISGAPENGSLTSARGYDFGFSASDANGVTYAWELSASGTPVTNGVAGAASVSSLPDGEYALSATATDMFGNTCQAVVRTWTLDTTAPSPKPVVAGLPGALTNQKTFTLTASGSTDAHGVTYRWMFNGQTVTGDMFDVATTADGNYSVSVVAVDGAGNESEATTVNWELDATVPTPAPVVTGLPGALTNQKTFALTVSGSTDKNGVMYRWTFIGQTSEGNTFDVATTTDGNYSVSVVAVDGAGNESEAATVSWTLDATAPSPKPVVAGLPGTLTNQKTFTLTASGSTDAHGVAYRWTFNGQTSEGNTFDVATTTDGNYSVGVVAVDNAGNESEATTVNWELDATKPTKPTISGLPGALTDQKTFTLTASGSTDAHGVTYRWAFNGQTAEGNTFDVATTTDGNYSVSVIAVDNAGNESEATTVNWELDATAPSPKPSVAGLLDALTNQKTFTLTASGSTDKNGVTYRWTFNGATAEGDSYTVVTTTDDTYSVSVVAVDDAGNESAPTTVSWMLDATAPSGLAISGSPLNGSVTNEVNFSFSATATDASTLTFHWAFGAKGAETAAVRAGLPLGEAFTGAVESDGEYEVSVYATDAAGNVSTTNWWTWTVETEPPADLALDGTSGVVATADFRFTASATDDSQPIAYHWTLNDVESSTTSATLQGVATEGTNTVSVYATDAAGNSCAAVTRKWVVDLTAPSDLVAVGTPADGSVVNASNFTFAAVAEDATELTFHWTFAAVGAETAAKCEDLPSGGEFTGAADEDGEYEVSVYATDEAGNASVTNTVRWTLDTLAPSNLVVTGTPADGSLVTVSNFTFAAAAEDATDLTFHWTFAAVGAETPAARADLPSGGEFTGAADADGDYEVSVYATDEAGNVSITNTVRWTLDATGPADLTIHGEPPAVTADNRVNLSASATDPHPPITFEWTFNGAAAGAGAAFTATAVEGTNTVNVSAADALGNESGRTYTWFVDSLAPSNLVVIGAPADGSAVNTSNFTFTAAAEDATALTFHWAFAAVGAEAAAKRADLPSDGEFTGAAEADGDYEVSVYATDAAGNVSVTNTVRWTFDTVRPAVELTSSTPNPFNANDTFTVTATFSEPVTNFTAASLTVSNGSVSWGSASQDPETANRVFTATITPTADGEISVQVAANVVADAAGNGNEASETLTRTCDITRPTVTLTSSLTEKYFKSGNFTVEATFSKAVTNFTASLITVVNGTVGSVSASSDCTYTFTVTPIADGPVTVQIADHKAANEAGNWNEASNEVKHIYDSTYPSQPVISGTPANGATTSESAYSFTADVVEETTEPDDVEYLWYVDDKLVPKEKRVKTLTGTITGSGTHTVRVIVRDGALNRSDSSATWTWTYESGESSDVEFGGGVCVKVNSETGATNGVSFTAIDFKPGEASTFTLSGFDASTQQIPDFGMWFIVGDTLDGAQERVKVDGNAVFNSQTGELTVTLPATATQNKSSFFIFGIDNKAQ